MQPEHPARPLFAGNASPGPALRDRVFAFAPANTAQSVKLIVHRIILLGCRRFCGPLITFLSAEQGPNEAAEFSGNGDLGFVALQPAGEQPGKAQVQTVLRFPTELAHSSRLAFLATGEFFADFGRQRVVLSAFS